MPPYASSRVLGGTAEGESNFPRFLQSERESSSLEDYFAKTIINPKVRSLGCMISIIFRVMGCLRGNPKFLTVCRVLGSVADSDPVPEEYHVVFSNHSGLPGARLRDQSLVKTWPQVSLEDCLGTHSHHSDTGTAHTTFATATSVAPSQEPTSTASA